jgi:hypothetical protein
MRQKVRFLLDQFPYRETEWTVRWDKRRINTFLNFLNHEGVSGFEEF